MTKPIKNVIFEPETASQLFDEVMRVLWDPDYAKVYQVLNNVFQKCLMQFTEESGLNLAGSFAKTDYLLKVNHAPRHLIRHTNDTRSRLRRREMMTEKEMERWCMYDARNLCEFIALLYHADIPAPLLTVFPAAEEEEKSGALTCECLRLIISRWDDEFVYGTSDEFPDGREVSVCYAHGNRFYDYDWTYLKEMFYPWAQLNIVRPREKNGIIYPELIIFEPDYLVDISAVARCFTNYAESGLVHLINKLSPSKTTEDILLGNFAGQLLDEQVHHLPDTHTYKDSATEFWQNNAISLLTTGVSANFHGNAAQQKQHIARAIDRDLPKNVPGYNPKECMLEPSFYSEMLGLQGRMDFLQLDYKVLLEQKSGKGEFPYDHFHIPRHKEEHYVQMLLYMMLIRYNFRAIYEQNNQELHAFLLYSKYDESLLGLGFSPELMFRAIRVRNEVAWRESTYTHPDGFRFLEQLTPDSLNLKQTQNNLWDTYQKPQLTELLAPIRRASDLEKAYYFRFLSFIANEHMLSKLGNKTKENSGFASKWYDSLQDKRQAGNIYDKLTLLSPDEHHTGNVEHILLGFSDTANNDMSNFRKGDIVILYSYAHGQEPDARATMVFRCVIEDIASDVIRLVLNAKQSDAHVFLRDKDKPWAIEHDFMESSYGALYRGMHAFLSAPQQRKDLLLLQREPEVDASRCINGEYGVFNELVARTKQARDLFLIIGPPGTGKTSFGLLNTLKEELTEPGSTVLMLSYTNRAVDEMCSKLVQEGIDFIRIGGEHTCSPEYRDKLLGNISRRCRNVMELKQIILGARVMVSTTSSMSSHLSLFNLKTFSLAIIDEASQILEPHLMGILCAQTDGKPSVGRIVMIGDHKQLPAVVQQQPSVSAVKDLQLDRIFLTNCRLSLFERLLKKYRNCPDVVFMLRKQGRMHPDIAQFSNQMFYNGQLEPVPLPHQSVDLPEDGSSDDALMNLLATRRIAFILVDAPDNAISNKVNVNEARLIADMVKRIYEMEKDNFRTGETVGVIVPYRNQIATVRNIIDRMGIPELHDITIDTVERYQGSQRRYIIYGFTIQEYHQLKFLTDNVFMDWDGSIIDRKLNVAMTRAEEHLIMVGNAPLLSNNYIFSQMIEFVRKRNGYFENL